MGIEQEPPMKETYDRSGALLGPTPYIETALSQGVHT